jgi:glycerol uptake facilitator-like aquaporin
MKTSLTKQCIAEFIGTFALIFIGIGAIYNLGGLDKNGGLLGIALAHGLTIAVMVSATGGISGGHLNPAVTFGLMLADKTSRAPSLTGFPSSPEPPLPASSP